MSAEVAIAEFKERFGGEPEVVTVAPGRINLIGEHTDYNQGFVFPAAIDRYVWVAASRSEDGSQVFSLEKGAGQPFNAATTLPGMTEGWAAYPAGMAWAIRESELGAMPNIHAVVSGEIPIGSGISSSAAIELAFGLAMLKLAGKEIEPVGLARIAQRCENGYVGVNSGIMDQLASMLGKAGHAIFIDIKTLETRYAPLPKGVSIAICDTGRPRALAASQYNQRRNQCEAASRALGVETLRDATLTQLMDRKPKLDSHVFQRALHVVTENQRCLDFAEALDAGNLQKIGELMRESHASLRDDYAVSSKELDAMSEACNGAVGCIGARMTGAGFGGACVALVYEEQFEAFRHAALDAFLQRTGIEGAIQMCQTSDGARVVA